MEMDNYNLSRLADDVPRVLSRVQKPRLLPDLAALNFNLPSSPLHTEEQTSDVEDASVCDDFFDFALYGGLQYNEAESSSKSDDSSMPGLTSATATTPTPSTPSDEGRDSPLRDVEDRSKFKAKLKEVKQGDDRFTFPQRELKPKGGINYHPNIHIHNPGQSPPSSTADFPSSAGDVSWLTPSSTSRGSSVRSSPPGGSPTPTPRGKRTGPLKNGEEVAGVRATGSCFCCKLRKVKCDQEYPCHKCVDKARKYAGDLGSPSAHQICFRRPLEKNALFQLISNRNRLSEGSRSLGNGCQIDVFFGPTTAGSPPLKVSVVIEDNASKMVHDECSYRLDLDRLPDLSQLCKWSSAHMASIKPVDFQAALDVLIARLAQSSPSNSLVQKVYQMRCLYKIWRQRELFYQQGSDQPLRLPRLLQTGIGNIVKSTMKGLESDILRSLNKTLSSPTSAKPHEPLPLWASMMQMILMYRDLHILAESACSHRPGNGHYYGGHHLLRVSATLFSALVVACEVCFAKKGGELAEDCKREERQGKHNIKDWFFVVENRQDEFFRNLNDKPGSLDQLLRVLGGTTKKTNPAKRMKTSK